MNELMAMALSTWVPALAFALLHFLWQGAAIGLAAWVLLVLLRNAQPQARYAVACAALLACVLLPAWGVFRALSTVDDTPAAIGILATNGAANRASGIAYRDFVPAFAETADSVLPWIVVLWAAGACLLSLRMGLGALWVRRLCRNAHVEADGRWQACLDRLLPRIGMTRTIALRLVDTLDGPVTAGWWRPVVLLPVAVAARMPADLVEALIAHELAHVRRHDYLANLLQGIAEALLFYHPVVWWLSHRIRIERELVADDLAATALGEPRRLALALAELDRHLDRQSPTLLPHHAPAAHGGHLMSRIRQLACPAHRSGGSAIVLPLVGLAVACAAFYAHARMVAPPRGFVQVSPAAAMVAQPLPAPTATALPAPRANAQGATILASAAGTGRAAESGKGDDDHDSYALVRRDRDGITMHGNVGDVGEIRAARSRIDGDFLWFRRDGKAWIVQDAATLGHVREAWAETDALSEQMEGLDARMRPHSEKMEALSARMDALDDEDAFESPDTRAATARMEQLGERMEALADRQVAAAERMRDAGPQEQARLEREQEALAREQETVQAEMERHSETLEQASERMQAQHEPMEALSREMEAASKPMEAIGRDMEVLGEQIERKAAVADGKVRQLIDRAYQGGQVQLAPTQQ